MLHLQVIGIRLVRVKGFTGPHDRDHIGVAQVFDVMGIPGGDIHHLQLSAADEILEDLLGTDLAEADDAGAADHQELFVFAVVPVVALGNAGLGDVDGYLASIRGLDHFGKGAPLIHVHGQRVAEAVLGQVA